MFGVTQALHNRRNDVAASAPDCTFNATYARSPEPGILAAPLADGGVQLPPRCLLRALYRARNLRILNRPGKPFLCAAAPVHLYVVEAPLGELQKILLVMPLAARMHVLRPGVRVH